jgi:rhodanese-related sulfurtransferase
MKNKILWAITAVLGLMLAMQQLQASQGVDVKTAQSMVSQGALLLDVREPSEYAAVHAVNAKLLPLGQVESRLQELEAFKNQPVAVICRSGRRSAQAVSILQEAGFTQVVNVQGGTNAWVEAGLDVIAQR